MSYSKFFFQLFPAILLACVQFGCSKNDNSTTPETKTTDAPPPAVTPEMEKSSEENNKLDEGSNSVDHNKSGEDNTPENALRKFLLAMNRKDVDRIKKIILSNPDQEVLWQGEGYPKEQLTAMDNHTKSIVFQRLKPGDKVKLPGGAIHIVQESQITEDQVHLTFSNNPVPFITIRQNGEWKVDARTIIAARKAASAYKKLPNWTPDEKLLSTLKTEVPLTSGYKIRIPAIFADVVKKDINGGTSFTWRGDTREDGTAPFFAVMTLTRVPELEKTPIETQLLQSLSQVKQRRTNWKTTELESGKIGGTKFVRMHWSGISVPVEKNAQTGRQMHGFMYIGLAEKHMFLVMSQDVVPHHETALLLSEAATLTLRKE